MHEADPRRLDGAALCAALAGLGSDEVPASLGPHATSGVRSRLDALRSVPTREQRAETIVRQYRALLDPRRRVVASTGGGARLARALLAALAPHERAQVARTFAPDALEAAARPDVVRAIAAAQSLSREDAAHVVHAFVVRSGRGPTLEALDELAYLLGGGAERVGALATGVARSLRARGVDLAHFAARAGLLAPVSRG